MMKFNSVAMLVLSVFLMGLAGCASSTKVQRVETAKVIDLSGSWNDSDATMVSDDIVKDCLSARWIDNFIVDQKRNPVVIVGYVKNQTDEHINSAVYVKHLEQALVNSGRVKLVASSEEREQIRGERTDQNKGFSSPETVKKFGREKGADFMMIGRVNTVRDETKGQYVVLYQTNLELVNLESNEKVWIGSKEIKKFVKVGKYSL